MAASVGLSLDVRLREALLQHRTAQCGCCSFSEAFQEDRLGDSAEGASWLAGGSSRSAALRLPCTAKSPGQVLILQWLIRLGMATLVTASATSRRQQQQEGTSTRSRPTITGCSINSVSATWLITLRWALRLLVASPRRCAPCSLACLSLRRQLRPRYLLLSGHGQQWDYRLTFSRLFLLRLCGSRQCRCRTAFGMLKQRRSLGMLKRRRSQGQLARILSSFSAACERHTD